MARRSFNCTYGDVTVSFVEGKVQFKFELSTLDPVTEKQALKAFKRLETWLHSVIVGIEEK